MKNTKKIIISLSVFLILIIPVISFADLVACDKNCGFNEFMDLVNTVIKFILFDMVIPIAAIMFAYAGFLLITAGSGVAETRTKAKSIFYNAVLGLIFAVAAFLIIQTILAILGYKGSWIGFNNPLK